ncbi:HlyD family secretion protein [Carboxylicivirga sp. N1Y90]|uniref:HlyD family secretion protein n=1 Tax=Carboxylicivirga fragile TaxID=3417571 RepID=UPI003D330B16|nr:HlyD family efflux transporter periplasmic adaptor subunit [Marinilabiliaceae bacterium N1Y90]
MNNLNKVFLSGYFLMLALVGCQNSDDASDAYGNFEATDAIISSEVSGKVLQVYVDEGELVPRGELITLIDTTILSIKKQQLFSSKAAAYSKIAQVNASKEVLKAQRAVLAKDVERIYNMYKDNAATSKQLDDVQGQLRVMEKQMLGFDSQIESIHAEVAVIEAQVIELNDQLERCEIRMPMEATILQKFVENGEMSMAGKPVVKVADLSKMYLRAFISGSQLSQVEIGQSVEVRYDKNKSDNSSINGKISWISSSAEFTPKIIQTKEERVDLVYAIKVLVENNGQIKIGMPGEIKF